MMQVYDATPCAHGEGPLWHPVRNELFWFDIDSHRLMSKARVWQFDEPVSAAGWVDADRLLIASASELFVFDLQSGAARHIAPLEADKPENRSNDGRADPQGGFWIGTMGRDAQPNAGAIYRYYRGDLRVLMTDITITNSICFAPDGRTAYYCDTLSKQIMATALDADGWPTGLARVAVDMTATGEHPDGSVVDADGNIWNAQWGDARLACYAPTGALITTVPVPAPHVSCPAFAGATGQLFATTSRQGLTDAALSANPAHGQTFVTQVPFQGQPEHQVIL